MLSYRAIRWVGVVAAVASAGLTLLPWIDVSHLGVPIRWNGLGFYIGDHRDHYGALLTGMVDSAPGWVVLIASISAAGALWAATRVQPLGLVACGCALIACGVAALSVLYPAVLVGDAKRELGIAGLPDRWLLNSTVLISEIATTAVLVVCAAFLTIRQRVGDGARGAR